MKICQDADFPLRGRWLNVPCLVQFQRVVNTRIRLQRIRNRIQAGGLGQADHQVHVLHGLAGGPFHQIVDGRQQDQPAGAGVQGPTDVAEIGSLDKSVSGQRPSGNSRTKGLPW